MKLTPLTNLTQFFRILQGSLFPALEEELGPLTGKQRQLVTVLGMIHLETLIAGVSAGWVGRPATDRRAIGRAFVAKAVCNMSTTRELLERLASDHSLRRLCGWESVREIPHESQFSRAFSEFARTELPQRLHAALIEETQKDRVIGHISRDSTEIEAREKPVRPPAAAEPPKPVRKKGRPKKGEGSPVPEPTRLERQAGMSVEQMLADLPRECNVGCKTNSKGYKESWQGYKLHWDVADGQIPISCLLSSASMHDSQAAIPLAEISASRVTNLYDLMDSAYDAVGIHAHSRKLARARSDHRCQSTPGRWAEGRVASGGEAPQIAELGNRRGPALSRTYGSGTGERAVKGRVRWADGSGTGKRQGDVPSDVRHRGIGCRSNRPAGHVREPHFRRKPRTGKPLAWPRRQKCV